MNKRKADNILRLLVPYNLYSGMNMDNNTNIYIYIYIYTYVHTYIHVDRVRFKFPMSDSYSSIHLTPVIFYDKS